MSRIIEKYCGFHRNDTLLKRHNSFLLKKTWLRLMLDHNRRHAFWLLVRFLGF
ncbi:hypothetical protein HPHPP23_0157 [Helicobacter pylori Hp P-23]|nr:hypothetical protein HPHPH27_0230 [Helicobacter pylori Hp H-27]EJC13741.1 hypothetical protein HPHPP23_0157 [Helicobacter pylori Hp P-23]